MKSTKFYLRKIYRYINTIAKYFSKWEHLESIPPSLLHIELTNICNANCIFCGYQYDKSKKGIMSAELYSQVLREYRELGGESLAFASFTGEPLIDHQIIDRIKEAKFLGFRDIAVWTNGILLHKYNLEDLLKSGMDSLFISTAPFEKERFERLYRNRDYKKLLEGVEKILLFNKKFNKRVKIEICLRSDISRKEALRLNDYQKYIRPYIDDEKKEVSVLLNGYDNWSGMITEQDLIGRMEFVGVMRYKPRPCRRMFELLIKWDGNVRACGCRFSNSEIKDDLSIGRIGDSGLKTIWFGDKLKKLRRSFINKTISAVCRDCGLYAPV